MPQCQLELLVVSSILEQRLRVRDLPRVRTEPHHLRSPHLGVSPRHHPLCHEQAAAAATAQQLSRWHLSAGPQLSVVPGSWSIQMERGNALVVLRSLLWPGLTFYHAPRTKNYGYIYVGTGEKNMDLPFML